MPIADYWYCACCGAPSQIAFETCPECGAEPEWMTEDEFFGPETEPAKETETMTNNSENLKTAPVADEAGPRPIRAIIADLSKPVNPQRLKQRTQGGRTLDYLPWYQAVRYLDHYAPGWRYEIRSVSELRDMCVVTVRITIPCAEGAVYREATGIEPFDVKGYGDPVSNAASMALRRCAAHFGLALHLYQK